tara:strand:+ start:5488 stop:5658 length:171 start_codon:yes stop_codon:yes gene_type:complete
MKTITFHIYKKGTNEVIKCDLTIDELEQMLSEKQIDWSRWEIQPCYTEYSAEDASF